MNKRQRKKWFKKFMMYQKSLEDNYFSLDKAIAQALSKGGE